MIKYFAVLLAIIFYAISVDAVKGYDVIDNINGATLKGTVNFKGSVVWDSCNLVGQSWGIVGKS